jgi:transposase
VGSDRAPVRPPPDKDKERAANPTLRRSHGQIRRAAVEQLDEITGVGRTPAQTIIAEIGTDMARFPTPGHLASWARYAPGVKQSAGKAKGKATTGHGNPYLVRGAGRGRRGRRADRHLLRGALSAACCRLPANRGFFGSGKTHPAEGTTSRDTNKWQTSASAP